MKRMTSFIRSRLSIPVLVAAFGMLSSCAQAQTTATWTGGGGDGLWNTAANWDQGLPPAEGTNAVIGAGNLVTYTAPMTATSFAGLTNAGTLTINAGGFNIEAGGLTPYFGDFGGSLIINSGGVMLITNAGDWRVNSNHTVAVEGGALIVTNNPGGTLTFGPNGNQSTANAAGFTNNAGTVIFGQPFQLRGRYSRFIMNGGKLDLLAGGGIAESSNDQERPWLINGGTANLGDFSITRTTGGGGLLLSNGVVTTTRLRIGTSASRAYATIYGGALTNTGPFLVSDRSNGATSSDRRIRLLIRGGAVVSTDPSGIVVCNQANASAAAESIIGALLELSGGVLIAEGITLVADNSFVNAYATFTLSGSGIAYLGSAGLTGNPGSGGSGYWVNLNGGTLAAKDSYTINADVSLGGSEATLHAADAGGVAHDITLNGVASGGGTLFKTGGGTLTLNAANTCSGNTIISAGRLSLGAAGSLSGSPSIFIGGGATFDVSAVTGYTLGAGRTILGTGTVAGDCALASGAVINPGTNITAGTLTFSGALTQTGGAFNHFDLSANPSGPDNDLVVIGGDLNVSGVNTIEVIGGGAPGSVHPLFRYGGSFNGTLANFTLSGASGSLSNNTGSAKGIYLVIASSVRSPARVTWVGNATVNDWDLLNRTNWLNNGALDYFVSGDEVRFDAAGEARSLVNIVGNVAPAMVTVDATANYTFQGDGSITGSADLLKTNSGLLTVLTTNSYTGVTTIAGGVLVAPLLANGGSPSSIGAASFNAQNLVFDGGTLRYLGDTIAIDRAATINAGGATLDVASGNTMLTLNNSLGGAGFLHKTGAGTLRLAGPNAYAGGTVISGGTLQIDVAGAAGTAGVTNHGATLRVNGALTLDNPMEFNGDCVVDLASASGNTALRGAWTGTGTVLITNLEGSARTFTIGGGGGGGGHMWDFAGTVDFGNNPGFFRINNDNGNFNFGSSNATFNVGTNTAALNQRNGGTTTHLGALIGGPNTTLAGRGNTGASGTTTYSIGGKNLSTTFEGSITDGSERTALIKVGTGTLRLTGTASHTGDTTVADGNLRVDGQFSASPVFVAGGVLSGSGSFDGPVEVLAEGTLSPGPLFGTLTFNNTLTLGGRVVFEVSKEAGQDQIYAGGVNYGGTLVVTNVGGPLSLGDSFQLFSAGMPAGDFASIVGSPGAGLAWQFDPATGLVSVVAGSPKLEYVQSGGSLKFSWSGDFKLQVQTNSLNVGLGDNWVDYPGGGTSGVNVPVDLKSPSVFFRLTKP